MSNQLILDALQRAETFMEGFEDDNQQENIADNLEAVRNAISILSAVKPIAYINPGCIFSHLNDHAMQSLFRLHGQKRIPLYTAAHVPLTVAKLKWKHDEYGRIFYTATSPVLTFHTVTLITDGLHVGKWERSGGDVGVYYDTEGEAMDAESDDLAQRVRSMIEAPLPSVTVTDEQIIDLLAIHSNHKEKAVARDGSGVIEYEVISHARAIKFARAIVEATHPAQVQEVASKASPVEAFAEMLDALENARELLEYGGFDLEKIDRAISNGRAIASAVATPARQLNDLGKLEFHLKSLVSAHPEKARLASSREDLRMFFVAELTKVASGRIPLLEIEGLVSRQLAVAKGGDA
ncbi:hypothetical protein [Agrobacterium tumefaciens]|uniref:hypothetical protein n=1 Tax=Agrobacterium tumefaciens TaxID=358 RepID=UPI0015723C19|nr:hypothetical protein [Agrobacterium tumefaciens]WCK01060.1 hypothetical protein G6L31_007190 [Agrobacterium tumefaciens]